MRAQQIWNIVPIPRPNAKRIEPGSRDWASADAMLEARRIGPVATVRRVLATLHDGMLLEDLLETVQQMGAWRWDEVARAVNTVNLIIRNGRVFVDRRGGAN